MRYVKEGDSLNYDPTFVESEPGVSMKQRVVCDNGAPDLDGTDTDAILAMSNAEFVHFLQAKLFADEE